MSAWLLFAMLAGADVSTIGGVVHDSSGGAVAFATVIVRTASGAEKQVVTGPDGRFTIDTSATDDLTLIVRADGFAEKRQPVSASGDIEVVLSPATLLETVVVTATRTEQTPRRSTRKRQRRDERADQFLSRPRGRRCAAPDPDF
jgi:hypothetical protein